jgi:hypothetical protein
LLLNKNKGGMSMKKYKRLEDYTFFEKVFAGLLFKITKKKFRKVI